MGIYGSFMTIMLILELYTPWFWYIENNKQSTYLPSKNIDMILIKTWELAQDEAYPIRRDVFILE